MSDDLAELARKWDEKGPPQAPFYATGVLIAAMADRIEELEDQLSKAVDFIEDLLSGRDRDDDWRIEANAILAAQKGQDDE